MVQTGAGLDSTLLSTERVAQIRASYERQATAISSHLLMALPPWIPEDGARDNWRTALQKPSSSTFAVSDRFIDDDDDEVEDRSA